MLEDVAEIHRIILACGFVDLRKGIDGLAMIVGKQRPFEKCTLFLFCGRRLDRIKGFMDGDGIPKVRYSDICLRLSTCRLDRNKYSGLRKRPLATSSLKTIQIKVAAMHSS